MEQVIAYKAFNGRLFDTEDKCIAYEKKMSQYPKVKETTKKADDTYIILNGEDKYIPIDIVCHFIETQEKHSAHKKYSKYFIVGGKYKFVDCFGKHEKSVMCGNLLSPYITTFNWYEAFKHFAELILNGNELNDNYVNNEIEIINKNNGVNKLTVEIIEPNRMWKIDNPRWISGAVAPYTFTIEKIN